MQDTRTIDAFLNAGMPQYAEKIRQGETLTKNDIKNIIENIKGFDSYYLKGWKESTTREIIKNIVNEYITIFKWFSINQL